MDTLEKLKIALKAALDKKAENPVIIDLKDLTTLADYFLIITVNSDVHGRTIADEIRKKLKEEGIVPLNIEGYDAANWILIDYGDLIVHIFKDEFRELYNLESLWMDAPRVEIADLLPEETGV
ncbi:iojap-like protein [Desulfurobacterium thermolithotrophum DSM 11699]|uniref:Ribosomal silencing factor RsfS n=1 Tax=Desulfurobacterium thermolithotrophum (strain DSM 11699 / BSA) TaxID=868864 RepID=F0S0T6_DESTD|nr:ribosome silencing factor [Desulfurobacterium thermolithotrophum]ADY72740.1 iojap-like protein [Desulfurobacterium thermolithotrophum DSM 11699]